MHYLTRVLDSLDSDMNLSLYSVAGFLVLDTDGHRVLAKYYRPKHNPLLVPLPDTKQLSNIKEQKAFEKGLWEKTRKPGGQQLLLYYLTI